MVFVEAMEENAPCNDEDDELTFVRLAAVTANVVRFLKEKQPAQDGARNDSPTKQAHEKEKERLRYLNRRISDLREFERRARGE